MAIRLAGLCLLFTLVAACGPQVSPGELPELPPVVTDGFLPVVSDQLQRLTQAVTDDPLNPKKAGRLGIACLAYELDDVAEIAFRRARMLQPGDFQWLYYHAEVLSRLRRFDESVVAYAQAAKIRPSYMPARIHLGRLYMQLGDLEAAETRLTGVVDDEPDNNEAQLALARLYLRSDKPDIARVHLERLIDQVGPSGSVYFALADAMRRLGDQSQAARYLELFERYRGVGVPIDDPLLKAVADTDRSEKPLLRMASRLNQLGRTDEAMQALHLALERNPDSHLTHAALVGAYGAMKQFDKVDEHYRLALESVPPTAPLLRNLGRARFHENRLAEARQALEQALELNPHDTSALTWLGLTRLAQRDTEEGLALLVDALEQNPREAMARHNLVNVLRRQGRHAEAVIHMKELLIVEDKHSPRVWRELGESYIQLGQAAAARDALTNAVTAAKKFGEDAEARRSTNLLEGIDR